MAMSSSSILDHKTLVSETFVRLHFSIIFKSDKQPYLWSFYLSRLQTSMASSLDLFEEFILLEGTKIGLLKQD